jgi:alpha-tubulin suppressor-like RCC1 family protein
MRRSSSVAWVLGLSALLVACPLSESPPLPPLASVSAGALFSLALDLDGNAWSWGYDREGQLGIGSFIYPSYRKTPMAVRMPSGVRFTQVAAGSSHSLALDQNGDAWGWGTNHHGVLGDGSLANRSVPVRVVMPSGIVFTDVAVTTGYSLALDQHGAAWAWGNNDDGWPEDGGDLIRSAPGRVSMPAGVAFTNVSAGGWRGTTFSLALDEAGHAWAWGGNGCGQLGDGTRDARSAPVPVTMPAGVAFTVLAAGGDHALALDQNGNAWAWGCNDDRQLGNDSDIDRWEPVPVHMPATVTFVGVAAAGSYSLAVDASGGAWDWGRTYRDRDTPTLYGTAVPIDIPEGAHLVGVSTTGNHALALDADGIAWAWGDNMFGQLGDGSFSFSSSPVRVGR